MAFPLVGLLAAGALAGETYNNFEKKRDRARREGVVEENEGAGPDQLGRALFAGGFLDGNELLDDLTTRSEGNLDRQTSLDRARITSGPGYMNAHTNRMRLEFEQAQVEAAAAQQGQAQDWLIDQATTSGTPGQVSAITNPFTPGSVVDAAVAASVPTIPGYGPQGQGQGQQQQTPLQQRADQIAQSVYGTPLDQIADLNERLSIAEQARTELRQPQPFDPKPQNDFIEAVQPLQNRIVSVDGALSLLEEYGGKLTDADWRTSEGALEARSTINKIVAAQRMDYWTNTLGRTDAPSESESRDLEAMFPTLEPVWQDGKTLALVRKSLREARASATRQIESARGAFERTSGSAPAVGAANGLDPYWSVQGGN